MESLLSWFVDTFGRPTISLGVLAVIISMLCLQVRLGFIALVAGAAVALSYWSQIVGFLWRGGGGGGLAL